MRRAATSRGPRQGAGRCSDTQYRFSFAIAPKLCTLRRAKETLEAQREAREIHKGLTARIESLDSALHARVLELRGAEARRDEATARAQELQQLCDEQERTIARLRADLAEAIRIVRARRGGTGGFGTAERAKPELFSHFDSVLIASDEPLQHYLEPSVNGEG